MSQEGPAWTPTALIVRSKDTVVEVLRTLFAVDRGPCRTSTTR